MIFYIGKLPILFKLSCVFSKPLKVFIIFKKNVYSLILPNNFFLFNYLQCFIIWNFTFKFLEFFSFLIKLKSIKQGCLKPYNTGIFLSGLGFRFFQIKKNSLVFKLGYSHLVKFYLKFNLKIFKPSRRSTKIFIYSPSKLCLSSFVSSVRLLRSPDNYKAKGFQVFGELVSIKKREKFGSF